jgi:hypothetical protein
MRRCSRSTSPRIELFELAIPATERLRISCGTAGDDIGQCSRSRSRRELSSQEPTETPGPSVAAVHDSGNSRNSVSSVAGVRANTDKHSSRKDADMNPSYVELGAATVLGFF